MNGRAAPAKILALANHLAVQMQARRGRTNLTGWTGCGYKYSFSPARDPCEPGSVFTPR